MAKDITLVTLREECAGCPTRYTGETRDGKQFEAYLRHGYMKITLDDEKIVSVNASQFDGVCGFSDFKRVARTKGYFINDDNAVYSSYYDDLEETVKALFKDKVWVEFVQDFYAKTQDKQYKKGERYTAKIDVADTLVKANLAVIDDDSYAQKKALFVQEKSNQ